MIDFKLVKNNIDDRLRLYAKATLPGGSAFKKAARVAGLQLINNIVNGSPKEPVVPPILTGRLRASGSVFVGSKLEDTTEDRPVTEGSSTPATSHSDSDNIVTVGFNTPYAARWHEEVFNPGPFSEQSGDVGNKYIEKHLRSDGPELMALFASVLGRSV